MPTKEQLEQENADLRAELEAARAGDTPPGTAANLAPPNPVRPDFGLSAGEAADLESNGVTTSPFNGEELNAIDQGITPGNPAARRNAEAAQKRKHARDAAAAPAPAADPAPIA